MSYFYGKISLFGIKIGKSIERWRRKATGLRLVNYDRRVAHFAFWKIGNLFVAARFTRVAFFISAKHTKCRKEVGTST